MFNEQRLALLQKQSNTILSIFTKTVKKLSDTNKKLEIAIKEANTEAQKHDMIAKKAGAQLQSNQNTIDKINALLS